MGLSSVKVTAPAKVNLFLEVIGKRSDGYHELDTVFCQLDLADELLVQTSPRPGVELSCDDPTLPDGPDNLIHRALAPIAETRGVGLAASLAKHIPAGGGLGGGSSDAAAALEAALRLDLLKEGPEDLAARALALGSDVPFFLAGGCQRGQGRGEVLAPLALPTLDLVLCLPKIHCSTPAVFRALKLGGEPISIDPMLAALEDGSPGAIAKAMFNRLEEPAFALWPELADLKARLLEEGCLGAIMSGSGSTVFGIAKDFAAAELIAAAIPGARVARSSGKHNSPPDHLAP